MVDAGQHWKACFRKHSNNHLLSSYKDDMREFETYDQFGVRKVFHFLFSLLVAILENRKGNVGNENKLWQYSTSNLLRRCFEMKLLYNMKKETEINTINQKPALIYHEFRVCFTGS